MLHIYDLEIQQKLYELPAQFAIDSKSGVNADSKSVTSYQLYF